MLETRTGIHTERGVTDRLTQACLRRERFRGVDNRPFQFLPGITMVESELTCRIAARYGLGLLNSDESVVLARSGFNIDEDLMTIPHTPQGTYPYFLSGKREARTELLLTDFRQLLMLQMIGIAQGLGIQLIKGIASENHPKVHSGEVPLRVAERIIDMQFERSGFTLGIDGNYYLGLKS